ncbi:Copia protein [Araneus ventricosus]|uniref:Copia protein n=1 Tax=Araneus ventricosus TaxID=182803 RepID=A0A4Y2K1F3_ARAVE|nr:Copia protein [Araneus ventricosus]
MALNREYTVAPFHGANFSVWNRRLKAIFAAKEPDSLLEKEADATNDTEVSKSKEAHAILLTFLDDNILSSLQKEDTAFKIWKALISTYEATGAVNQILTRKRLATIRKSKETSMRQHIDEILKLVSDLRVSGAEVSDIDSIVYILMSLPKEYESVKVALENQPNVNLTLEFVTQRLIDSVDLINDSKFVDKSSIKYPSETVTFAAKHKKLIYNYCSKEGHTSTFCKLKASKCFSCGKAGHYKRECPVSKTAADSGARHSAYKITFAVGTLNEDKFITDSGANSHMCSRKEWFSSLEPASGIIKCASKSAVLQVEGIVIIRGEISNNVNLNLKDVLYVPNLNGQLLSVQKIEAAVFCVIFKKEEVFLEKENKCLLFRHRKNCGQYISDFIPHCETSLKSDVDDLWNRRCGHSCNQSLKQLGLPTI